MRLLLRRPFLNCWLTTPASTPLSRSTRRFIARFVVNSASQPSEDKQALRQLVASLGATKFTKKDVTAALQVATQATAYQAALEQRIITLEEQKAHHKEILDLVNLANHEKIERLEGDIAAFLLRAVQAEGRNDPRGLFEEIEVWAVKEAKANPLDTRNKKWSAILKDRPFANDLLQCMQQHGFTRGAQDMVDLYRTLSTHTHQAPPLQALSGKKVGMSRGPLTRGQAQLLVCMAKLAHIELIIKEDDPFLPVEASIISSKVILPS